MFVTEFLGMYTSDLSRELLAQVVDMKTYLSALTEQLKAAASEIESGSFREYHPKCELISPLRCADRGSPCTYNRDTKTHRTTYRNRGRVSPQCGHS